MTESESQPQDRQSDDGQSDNRHPQDHTRRPMLILIVSLLLVLIIGGGGLWLQKRQDIGDCYDKYQRWDVRAEVCR